MHGSSAGMRGGLCGALRRPFSQLVAWTLSPGDSWRERERKERAVPWCAAAGSAAAVGALALVQDDGVGAVCPLAAAGVAIGLWGIVTYATVTRRLPETGLVLAAAAATASFIVVDVGTVGLFDAWAGGIVAVDFAASIGAGRGAARALRGCVVCWVLVRAAEDALRFGLWDAVPTDLPRRSAAGFTAWWAAVLKLVGIGASASVAGRAAAAYRSYGVWEGVVSALAALDLQQAEAGLLQLKCAGPDAALFDLFATIRQLEQYAPAVFRAAATAARGDDGAPRCQNCDKTAAEVHCAECHSCLCVMCSDDIHSQRVLAGHTVTPIGGTTASGSALDGFFPSPGHRTHPPPGGPVTRVAVLYIVGPSDHHSDAVEDPINDPMQQSPLHVERARGAHGVARRELIAAAFAAAAAHGGVVQPKDGGSIAITFGGGAVPHAAPAAAVLRAGCAVREAVRDSFSRYETVSGRRATLRMGAAADDSASPAPLHHVIAHAARIAAAATADDTLLLTATFQAAAESAGLSLCHAKAPGLFTISLDALPRSVMYQQPTPGLIRNPQSDVSQLSSAGSVGGCSSGGRSDGSGGRDAALMQQGVHPTGSRRPMLARGPSRPGHLVRTGKNMTFPRLGGRQRSASDGLINTRSMPSMGQMNMALQLPSQLLTPIAPNSSSPQLGKPPELAINPLSRCSTASSLASSHSGRSGPLSQRPRSPYAQSGRSGLESAGGGSPHRPRSPHAQSGSTTQSASIASLQHVMAQPSGLSLGQVPLVQMSAVPGSAQSFHSSPPGLQSIDGKPPIVSPVLHNSGLLRDQLRMQQSGQSGGGGLGQIGAQATSFGSRAMELFSSSLEKAGRAATTPIMTPTEEGEANRESLAMRMFQRIPRSREVVDEAAKKKTKKKLAPGEVPMQPNEAHTGLQWDTDWTVTPGVAAEAGQNKQPLTGALFTPSLAASPQHSGRKSNEVRAFSNIKNNSSGTAGTGTTTPGSAGGSPTAQSPPRRNFASPSKLSPKKRSGSVEERGNPLRSFTKPTEGVGNFVALPVGSTPSSGADPSFVRPHRSPADSSGGDRPAAPADGAAVPDGGPQLPPPAMR